MPISTCTVSGNVQNLLGQDVSGVSISVYAIRPFFHTGTLISGQIAQTSTDVNGDWSISLIETETVGVRLSFVFEYGNGLVGKSKKSYAVIIPDDPTAEFSLLVLEPPGTGVAASFPASQVTVVPTGNLTSTRAQAALEELQGDIDAINTLADGKIYLGNASNQASEVTISGDISLDNAGVASISAGSIVNADVNASAAIAVSKLAPLTASRAVESDSSGLLTHSVVTSTELGYLSGATSNIQAQINSLGGSLTDGHIFVGNVSNVATDVAMTGDISIDNTGATSIAAGVIVDADVNASAAIAVSKLAALTASRAVESDASGLLTHSAVTSTELGYVSGVTSAIQTQLNGKMTSALNDGNIFVGNVSNVATGVTPSGDITISNAGVTAIASGVIVDADVNASAAIAVSKLAALTASRAVESDVSGLLTHSAVTSTELGYVSGVTSAIQTQLNGKQTTALTDGNILIGNASNVAASVTPSGDITISNAGVTAIASGVIVDGDINASAAIARSKVANGTADHVVINSGAGALSSEAQLATSRGGTGQNLSSSTGALSISSGTVSAGTLGVSNGGTGATSLTANNVLLGNGTSALQVVAPGTSGNVLTSNGTTWTSAAPSAGSLILASYSTAAGQSISNATTTIVDFGTSYVDTNSAVTTGASWEFEAPSTGYYWVSSTVTFESNNDSGTTFELVLYKNGSQFRYLDKEARTGATVISDSITGGTVVQLDATDTIDVRVYQNSSVTRSLIADAAQNHITIYKL